MDPSMTGDAMTCSICYEEFKTIRSCVGTSGSNADLFDNRFQCSNNHYTCMRCIANLTMPARGDRSDGFSGIVIKCPVCREIVPLDVFQVLCVMRNSIRSASQEFPCIRILNEWVGNTDSASECPSHTQSMATPQDPIPNDEPIPRRSARLAARA